MVRRLEEVEREMGDAWNLYRWRKGVDAGKGMLKWDSAYDSSRSEWCGPYVECMLLCAGLVFSSVPTVETPVRETPVALVEFLCGIPEGRLRPPPPSRRRLRPDAPGAHPLKGGRLVELVRLSCAWKAAEVRRLHAVLAECLGEEDPIGEAVVRLQRGGGKG